MNFESVVEVKGDRVSGTVQADGKSFLLKGINSTGKLTAPYTKVGCTFTLNDLNELKNELVKVIMKMEAEQVRPG